MTVLPKAHLLWVVDDDKDRLKKYVSLVQAEWVRQKSDFPELEAHHVSNQNDIDKIVEAAQTALKTKQLLVVSDAFFDFLLPPNHSFGGWDLLTKIETNVCGSTGTGAAQTPSDFRASLLSSEPAVRPGGRSTNILTFTTLAPAVAWLATGKRIPDAWLHYARRVLESIILPNADRASESVKAAAIACPTEECDDIPDLLSLLGSGIQAEKVFEAPGPLNGNLASIASLLRGKATDNDVSVLRSLTDDLGQWIHKWSDEPRTHETPMKAAERAFRHMNVATIKRVLGELDNSSRDPQRDFHLHALIADALTIVPHHDFSPQELFPDLALEQVVTSALRGTLKCKHRDILGAVIAPVSPEKGEADEQ